MKFRNDKYFRKLSWEQKAKQSAAFAIQTNDIVANLTNEELLDPKNEKSILFFQKGYKIFNEHLRMHLNQESMKILEFGCGAGRILKALPKNTHEIHACDISKTQLKLAKMICPEVKYNLIKRTFIGLYPIDNFDLVYTFAVLKHIGNFSEYIKTIQELAKITKSGGKLILNLHCEDIIQKNKKIQTLNFENFSVDIDLDNYEIRNIHNQDLHWSGVYVSFAQIIYHLSNNNLKILNWYQHNPVQKPGNIWIIAVKDI